MARGAGIGIERIRNMKRLLGIAMVLALGIGSIALHAEGDPLSIVQGTTDQVLARVKNEKKALREDPAKMFHLVSELIFPHFDFAIMSQWVLGEHWNGADASMRESFVDQFRKLLVRTYATALLEFSDQKITYPPVDQKGAVNTAVVKQEIAQEGGGSIPIVYRLHNKSGDWKVFDVSVDGVSLVKTYRASFGSMIKDDGLDGLIASLNSKNRQYGD